MDQLARIAAPDALDDADSLVGTLRRHRIVPAMLFVEDVAQGVVLLVAWRRDIEAAAADKLHARGDEMQLVHHLPLLAVVRRVLGREGDDAGTIGPLVRASIDQCPHPVGITDAGPPAEARGQTA